MLCCGGKAGTTANNKEDMKLGGKASGLGGRTMVCIICAIPHPRALKVPL